MLDRKRHVCIASLGERLMGPTNSLQKSSSMPRIMHPTNLMLQLHSLSELNLDLQSAPRAENVKDPHYFLAPVRLLLPSGERNVHAL